MHAPDHSYHTPTCIDETGRFEILYDRGRKLRYDTPRARFITPLPGEPVPQIEWLWTDRIPRGRVTVIEGPAGAGKSFVTASLTASVTAGLPWGDGPEGPQRAGEVLYYCSERESEDVVTPRIIRNGADFYRVIYYSDVDMSDDVKGRLGSRRLEFPQDLNMLECHLKECSYTRLVVIDPLRDFCATPRLMRKALAVLDDLAAKYKVAIVVTIQADVKFEEDGKIRPVPRPWDEAARYVWCVTRDPCDPELRRFEPKRTTFCREPVGVAFRVSEVGKVTWEPLTKRQTRFQKCKTWLDERMGHGAVWADDAQRDARALGFSDSMVFRARDDLDIISDRKGGIAGNGRWWWTRDGQPPETPENGSEADETLAKYADLIKHAKLGDDFVKTLSAIVMAEVAGRSRSRRISRSRDDDRLKEGLQPVESAQEKISNSEMLAEMPGVAAPASACAGVQASACALAEPLANCTGDGLSEDSMTPNV